MQASTLLILFLLYFLFLFVLSLAIGRKTKVGSFYNGDRKSPWIVVAFGMVGATLSGVTFISVPGEVGNSSFHYLQFVLGNFAGYLIIALFLLPYYYKKNIYSIYSVLESKMGKQGYLSTSGFFILSKVIGAAFRLYLAAIVLDMAIASPLGIPFELTVLVCLGLIWLYTYKSGIKTVVWSDTIQTAVLLLAVIVTIFTITKQLNLDIEGIRKTIFVHPNTKIFNWNWQSSNFFVKQFLAGIFMTIALNGFDQDIIQKNLTCKNSNKARNNMLIFSVVFVFSVFLFLLLGALLYHYAEINHLSLPEKTDQIFPTLALNEFGKLVAVLFVLGISAAAFSSADSATTALTTAFSIDFLKLDKFSAKKQPKIRNGVHLGFSLILFVVIILFYKLNNQSVVMSIFKAAGYTYGPILGVFMFSFFLPRIPKKGSILPICLTSPAFTYLLTLIVKQLNVSYNFGFELIIINACFTLGLLTFFSKKKSVC